jgi:hypothetical protein
MGGILSIAAAIVGLAIIATVLSSPNIVGVINGVAGGYANAIKAAKG